MKPDFLNSEIVNVIFGKGVEVVKPCNIYGATIEDNVFIGPFVEIQSDVHIGKGSKIQSHTFICSLVEIGSNVFVGHGVMFINDTFSIGGPANGKKDLWKKTSIGNNVSIGSNATILPVSICSEVVIGAGSVVTKSITDPGCYAGNPAKKISKN
ncbi:N-acetyltransferase [Gammaproteobacteria bacterium]|nr:N-acetyltransferase [Gammaproteobacteria bacterium]MDC3312958.1 N-acetyltransferase [Gammaproteobacteria bacterium]